MFVGLSLALANILDMKLAGLACATGGSGLAYAEMASTDCDAGIGLLAAVVGYSAALRLPAAEGTAGLLDSTDISLSGKSSRFEVTLLSGGSMSLTQVCKTAAHCDTL
jgi:hypothetical protein